MFVVVVVDDATSKTDISCNLYAYIKFRKILTRYKCHSGCNT